MMRFVNLDNIINIIERYVNNKFKNTIKYTASTNIIKIKSDVSIVFILFNRDQKITNIDLCKQNCIIKGYVDEEKLSDLNHELNTFIGRIA